MEMKKKFILLFLSLFIIIFLTGCNAQFKDYSDEALETTNKFYTAIERKNFEEASEYVAPILKPTIKDFDKRIEEYGITVDYNIDNTKIINSNNEHVIVRVYYSLRAKSRLKNNHHKIMMNVYLAPIENEGIRIVKFKEINRKRIDN